MVKRTAFSNVFKAIKRTLIGKLYRNTCEFEIMNTNGSVEKVEAPPENGPFVIKSIKKELLDEHSPSIEYSEGLDLCVLAYNLKTEEVDFFSDEDLNDLEQITYKDLTKNEAEVLAYLELRKTRAKAHT